MISRSFLLLFLLSILAACKNITIKQSFSDTIEPLLEVTDTTKNLSDTEMIAYLNEHRAEFDSLKTWIIEDQKIEFMLPYSPDSRHLNNISQERADAYFDLMNELNIVSLSRGNGYRNAILFYFKGVKKDGKEINKGYVYKIDPNRDKEAFIVYRANGEDKYTLSVKTDEDIQTEAEKLDLNTFVYKPINEHWSLICLIQ